MPKTTLVTTLTALAGLALTAPAAAEPAPAEGPRWGATSSPLMRPGRAVRYWTAKRQANALTADQPSAGTALSAKAGARTTQRHSVPSNKRLTPGGDLNGYAPMSRPYTGAAHSRITGRLFFLNAAGLGDSCSASVIRSAARTLVLTAAHCVYGVPPGTAHGRWHNNFAFVPSYDGQGDNVRQREPYGRWGGRRAWKPDRYTGLSGGDWNSVYDIALIEVGSKRRTLQEAVGAFTPIRNEGGRHTIATPGYPGVIGRKPYDGRDQLWCLGRTRPIQPFATVTATAALAAHFAAPQSSGRLETDNCHLFKGHSGGPWLLDGTQDVVGVLSAGKEDGEAEGNSVATTLNDENYGAIVKRADPDGVYDALSVSLSGPSDPVRQGSATTITATVTMRGLLAAAQVPVKLTVPPGVDLTGVKGAACEHGNKQATCVIAAIHPRRPVRISARVEVHGNAGRSLPVVAHVSSSHLDPTQRDNTSVLDLRTSP
ncbi:trypsin-like serine peptidase [Nonomuraea purpurea]|uniref:Trypsin-like serine peptidase n=1 Tax=Nonomuraea purpurea TaxID=1849276 RepID=A0ABV8G0M8_9ACTN